MEEIILFVRIERLGLREIKQLSIDVLRVPWGAEVEHAHLDLGLG